MGGVKEEKNGLKLTKAQSRARMWYRDEDIDCRCKG